MIGLESRFVRWLVGIFVGSVTVVGGLLTVLTTIANQPPSSRSHRAYEHRLW